MYCTHISLCLRVCLYVVVYRPFQRQSIQLYIIHMITEMKIITCTGDGRTIGRSTDMNVSQNVAAKCPLRFISTRAQLLFGSIKLYRCISVPHSTFVSLTSRIVVSNASREGKRVLR